MSEISIAAGPRGALHQRWSQFVSCLLVMLGLVGLLRGGLGGVTDPDGVWVLGFVSHPITAVTHLILGMVGIYAATRPAWSRTFLAGLAGFMVPWAVLGLVLAGEPTDAFTSNSRTVALHLTAGVVSLVMAAAPSGREAARDG